jgi:hypothetical protein
MLLQKEKSFYPISKNYYVHEACGTAGITLGTYYTWLKRDKSFNEEFYKIKERAVK